jgi:hypothetical protein
MVKKYIPLILILLFAGFLLFFKLNLIPAGLTNDEVSEGYSAFSILKTGADRYGMTFPLLFKSFGTYLMPLYTYLTAAVFYVLGVNIVGVRLVSVVSGLAILLLTFLVFKNNDEIKSFPFSVVVVFVLSFAPWLIFFSRSSTEVTLSLAIFLSSFYFLIRALNKPSSFIIGCLFLGLSSWAYYSERLIVFIFLPIFIFIFRRIFFKYKKVLFIGIAVFSLTQVPNLLFIKNGATTRRLDQVSYLSHDYFMSNGDNLRSLPFGQYIYISKEFMSHYIAYFSPRNLFFDPDDQMVRSMPDLSVFYNWMVIPFILGIAALIKNKKSNLNKAVLILVLISAIPAALTREPFYTIRVLLFLWAITVVISYGIVRFPRILLILLFVYSLFSLYRSYFVLFKYERSGEFGNQYNELIRITQASKDKKFVIDNSRDSSICLRFAFFTKFNPKEFQETVGKQFLTDYYTNYGVGENCNVNNVEIRPIIWGNDIYKDQILVGDNLAISDTQINEHKIKFLFEIKDMSGNIRLRGYQTDPKSKCGVNKLSPMCKNIIY